MRDSYEDYLLGQRLPIPIIASEMTSDTKVDMATKNGVGYPVDKALAEVRLRSSSQAYKDLLKRDYAGLCGDASFADTNYVLHTDNMRTITIMHRSPRRSDDGKFLIDGALHPYFRRFRSCGITYEMLDRLQSGASSSKW